ncbi:Ig-like domain-containing protein [Haliangium ochraceum]|uniref:Ig domain protein group 2 domain protein n=1 Tax=Haliangium ochraceum (strain DSM 14365 / JCM 11303 / SMP-2) TaxID=502025 RepID=D0LMQ8_HALO1|nr:Ig-like domain-containing protein [Haliangium ochraceum]ACY18745.1 Ig domain protein group 2 domain protein [Haliangium ochraceum DSM 14365]
MHTAIFARRRASLLTVVSLSLIWTLAACGDDSGGSAMVSVTGGHLVSVGQTRTLSASTVGGTDDGYTWQSDDPAVASVDASGVVTGVAPGEVTLTARGDDTDAAGYHTVVVTQAVVVVSGSTVLEVGASTTLSATTVSGEDDSYTWTSSDPEVASVGADGVVQGNADGVVTLQAQGSLTGATGAQSLTVTSSVPNYQAWRSSGHADSAAEAFRHWDADEPAEVPAECARCHSPSGFRDYLGEDGSEVGSVEAAAPVGRVIGCDACHNSAAEALTSVVFPSGVELAELGPEARCMTCHQGRSSGDTVADEIANAGVGADEISDALHFINIHYYAAGATINAGRVRGGYQYEDELGAVYDWRFRHAPGLETCTGCHDPHSLEVRVQTCAGCHAGVASTEDLKNIRMLASEASDYDGDGDLSEGIYYEVQGLRTVVLDALRTYASDRSLGALCYAADAYPYFFIGGDASGQCSAEEASYGNRFAKWTPRLLKAAYNFQVASKDPGGFAHNGKYIIQLLHDAAQDLALGATTPIDLDALDRNDPGHFNGASEAARHWDEDDEVSASCSRCHGGSEGFRFFVEFGVGRSVEEQDNGLDCATCHEDLSSSYETLAVSSVLYPSGVEASFPNPVSNMCATCHSGREAKSSIDAAIAAGQRRFLNVHYLPAAAVKQGVAATVGYEYEGHSYAGNWDHAPGDACTFCHDPAASRHSFDVRDNFDKCTELCHTTALDPLDIRGNPFFAGALHAEDYDGDGSNTERLVDELVEIQNALLAEMQTAATADGSALCYSGDAYPYFFQDSNGNGACDEAEIGYGNRFSAWTPGLMKAAHNYQIAQKEGGAWVHNFDYIVQLLIDSTEDLGGAGAVSSFVRP